MQNSRLEADAMDLALLIYDLYKEDQDEDIIIDGQNNAQQTQSE